MEKEFQKLKVMVRPGVAEDFFTDELKAGERVKQYHYGMYFLIRDPVKNEFSWFQFRRGSDSIKSFTSYFLAGMIWVPVCSGINSMKGEPVESNKALPV